MKRIFSVTVLTIVVLSFFTGCYYDKAEIVYAGSVNNPVTCDTANLTYNNGIEAIINNRCYSCHAGQSPSSGINLDTYSRMRALRQEVVRRIKLPVSDPEHMPRGSGMLPDCEITKITTWVNNGAPQ
jgi:uncharacterized membrane protein